MLDHDLLCEVFNRAIQDGVETLTPAERELYLIQDFIIGYEMDGLSGHFYNRLPDIQGFRETTAVMRRRNLLQLATLLDEAADLFEGYADPDPPTTWSHVLAIYDPNHRLNTLNSLIAKLDDYGLSDANSG